MSEEIRVGDRVRSFDFEAHRDCYVEGTVTGFAYMEGCERYQIMAEQIVWAGQAEPAPKGYCVYPPVNGTPMLLGGECRFVVKLPADDALTR